MQLGKIAVYARKIHRILVLFISALSLVMVVTGLTLHKGNEADGKPLLNYNIAWSIHGTVAIFFAFILGCMVLTGLYLYSYPWLQKIIRPKPAQ